MSDTAEWLQKRCDEMDNALETAIEERDVTTMLLAQERSRISELEARLKAGKTTNAVLRERIAELEARCSRSAEFYGGQLENETHWTISHMSSGNWHVRVNTQPEANFPVLENAWAALRELGLWPVEERTT